MLFNILITKETRAGEQRVALIPREVKKLSELGHRVFLEHDAGQASGFSDVEYQKAGSEIRILKQLNSHELNQLFKNINLVVRVKRPDRAREILESQTIRPGTILIGVFDTLEKGSPHIEEYHRAKILAYSIDQIPLSPDDPMNLLSAMSKIAGRLALLDAIEKHRGAGNRVVILGFGTLGRSAFEEALQRKLDITVVLTNTAHLDEIKKRGAKAVWLDKKSKLQDQQKLIKSVLLHADIVIAAARTSNQTAPLLIPADTLDSMQKGAVIVDLALTEGGNVEGSEHDKTHLLGNGVIVTNVSGYPKAMPIEISKIWSEISFHYICKLASGAGIPLKPC